MKKKKKLRGKLLYPHLANTYILAYFLQEKKLKTIIRDGREKIEIKWKIEICDWDDISRKFVDESKCKWDIIVTFGTENTDCQCDKFNFSTYIPKLLFIPFNLSIYTKYYKDKKLESLDLIKAISDDKDLFERLFPSFREVEGCLKTKKTPGLDTDTEKQAGYISKKVLKGKGYEGLMYYSAPYTIHMLKHYPEFLPIRIEEDLLKKDGDCFKRCFETKILFYKKNNIKLTEDIIQKEIIEEERYQKKFEEERLEPHLLYGIFSGFMKKKYHKLPLHIFKDVNDFALAISLHHLYDEANGKIREIRKKVCENQLSLKKLIDETSKYDNESYFQQLKEIKELVASFYLLFICASIKEEHPDGFSSLIPHKKEAGIPESYFSLLADNLTDSSFLNGKYFFLFEEMLSCLINDFFNHKDVKGYLRKNILKVIKDNEMKSYLASYLKGNALSEMKSIRRDELFVRLQRAVNYEFPKKRSGIITLFFKNICWGVCCKVSVKKGKEHDFVKTIREMQGSVKYGFNFI